MVRLVAIDPELAELEKSDVVVKLHYWPRRHKNSSKVIGHRNTPNYRLFLLHTDSELVEALTERLSKGEAFFIRYLDTKTIIAVGDENGDFPDSCAPDSP